METRIINIDFQHPADGWYLIEPLGEHPNGDVVQVIDEEAAESIVRAFNAAAGAKNFPGMVIDREHFKHQLDKESKADGWLMRLSVRADGIYGQIRWTKPGQAAVDGGEYRFFSTEYDMSDCQVLSKGKPQRIRPMKLAGLSLTNMPSNLAGQRPITNSARASVPAAVPRDPAAAGRAFREVCDRLRSEHGMGWEAAWNHARLQEPGLFAAMESPATRAAEPLQLNRATTGAGAAVTAAQAQCATDRFKMLVLNRQGRRGISFGLAWSEVEKEFPDVCARAHGRPFCRNRFYIAPEDQAEVDKRAPDVLWSLRTLKRGKPEKCNSTSSIGLQVAFLYALKNLQEEGKSLEDAFAFLRENEPVFFARGVMAYSDPQEDAVPFKDWAADRRGPLFRIPEDAYHPRLEDAK